MAAASLKKFLARHKQVGVDTMVFIYHLQDHPRYSPLTQIIFESWEAGKNTGITSAVTLLEILVKPKRDENLAAASDYERLLTTYPNLRIADIDVEVASLAAGLRAKYSIKTPDALQVAACLHHGASGFITNDAQLKQLSAEGIEVLVLDDLL